jgi:hypothetical protein
VARLSAAALANIDEPVLPMSSLLGPGVADLLGAAVAEAGGDLRSAEPRQVIYHPRRSLTVRFDAQLRWPGVSVAPVSLVASVGDPPPEGAAVVDDGNHTVAIWQMPLDPHLPGLAAALDPDQVSAMLADLGVTVGTPVAQLRAYRPGRRAVVEVRAGEHRLFIKVVRPHTAERLHRRHLLLADHVPVPRPLGWSPEQGVLVLQALGGVTLRQTLLAGMTPPSGAAVVSMLDALPAPQWPARLAGWQADRFATMIASILPSLRHRVRALALTLGDAERAVDTEPLVPVHGDLHEAQLMVHGERITGLLDVDTCGPGRRIDDLAAMVGHLSTLACVTGDRHIQHYAAGLLAHFDHLVDPVQLRFAVAAVVLGLATGPFRVLEPDWQASTIVRVELAEQWAASTEDISRGERELIVASRLAQTHM